MFLHERFFCIVLSLFPLAILTGFSLSLQALGRLQGKEELEKINTFPYLSLLKSLRLHRLWNALMSSVQWARYIYSLLFTFVSFNLLFIDKQPSFSFSSSSFFEILFVVVVLLSLDLLLLPFTQKHPVKLLKALSFPVLLLLLPCFPVILIYIKTREFFSPQQKNIEKSSFKLKDKLADYLEESELAKYLDKTEAKLIHTMVSFKDRIVREVMVPRIDVFTLSSETSIKEAARHFLAEGYSRIPVHKENIDKIVGILLYKDILAVYANNDSAEALSKTIEHLAKPALYTPETKKIAQLLQEFKSKQTHLAVVVDEYGGTEGIVTIEDILEELVGEIEDEHDVQEVKHYSSLPSGGWVVDAKMNILDLEEELGIKIPQSVEYDTIGGFIFHKTGSIPGKGWKAHLDNVDLEILSSDERSIQKIKITQRRSHKSHS